MTSSPLVRKVGFTGSNEIGKLLMAQCAAGLKKISLELGGNAPFVVFDDADLDEAVAGTIVCKFRNSGQTCISANRILVQEGIYDAYLERLVEAVVGLKVGPGTEPDARIGPLIEDAALDKVTRHVADAIEGGAELHVGGERHQLGRTFFQPTVLTGLTAGMAMSHEETFGPVAGISRFSSEDEAVRIANDTEYGLVSYVWTRDLARGQRMIERLATGMMGLNAGVVSNAAAPFGGWNQSGLGREGGAEGIHEYLQTKYTLTPDPFA